MAKNPYSFNPPPGAGASPFKPGMSEIPTLDTCDLTDPREMFAWMFVQTPGLAGSGAELMLPKEWCFEMSERLYNCGARLHPALMEIRYVPPMPGASFFMGPAGKWEEIPEGQHPFRPAPPPEDSVTDSSVESTEAVTTDTEGSHSDSDDHTDDEGLSDD